MLGNDHFQSSWWGNYSVSSLSLPLMFPLSVFCPPPPPPPLPLHSHLCEPLVRRSRDLNSLWQLSGRVELETRHASQTWEQQRFCHVFHGIQKKKTHTHTFASENLSTYGHTCTDAHAALDSFIIPGKHVSAHLMYLPFIIIQTLWEWSSHDEWVSVFGRINTDLTEYGLVHWVWICVSFTGLPCQVQ